MVCKYSVSTVSLFYYVKSLYGLWLMLADPAFAAEMPMLVIIPVSQQRGAIAGSCAESDHRLRERG